MKNKNKRIKQSGSVNKLMLIMIIGGLGYSAYLAKEKGLISTSSISSIASSVSRTISDGISSNSYTGYGIQLMATKELDQAKSVMNDFAHDGYSAFVVKANNKGRSIYKVRLGPYSHKPEAIAVKDKVIRRYPNNPYVKASLVIYKP